MTEPFVQVPLWIVDAAWSSPLHVAVWTAVRRLGWRDGCYADRDTIATKSRVSPATVKRTIGDLEAGGALTVTRRPGTSSILTTHDVPVRAVPVTARTITELRDTPEARADPGRVRAIIEAAKQAARSGLTDPGLTDPGLTDPTVGSHRPDPGSHRPDSRVSQTREIEDVSDRRTAV